MASLAYPKARKLGLSGRAAKLAGLIGRAAGAAVPAVTAFSLLADAVNTADLVGAQREDYELSGFHYAGFVSVTEGKQYVLKYNIATGLIDAKILTCSRYTAEKDNHNQAIPWKCPALTASVVLACGHQTATEIAVQYSALGDLSDMVETIVSPLPGQSTYPYPMEDPGNGDMWCTYRAALAGTGADWFFISNNNNGAGTWSIYTHPYWHDTDQTYCYLKKIAANEYFAVASRNTNLGDAKLYCFRVNVSTGNIRNAAGTTIANWKTGAPAFAADPTSADVFYSPAAGWSASPGDAFEDGNARFFKMSDNDGQYDELWIAECSDPTKTYDPAFYTFSKICNAGYGCGSTTNTPFSQAPAHYEVFAPGVTNRRLAVGQILGGVNYGFIMEQMGSGGAWKNVLAYNQVAQNTDHRERCIGHFNGTSNAMLYTCGEDIADYNAITNASDRVLVVSSTGVAAPAITLASTYAIDEYQDLLIEATMDQPGGVNITGGADAANFEIIGGKYIHLIHAANFAAPHDANADNVFDLQLKSRGLNGLESAAFNWSVTINALTKTGGTNRFTQTAAITNAAWNKVGLNNGAGAGQINSADFLDSLGTNTLNKMQQDITTNRHRAGQTQTFAANTEYSVSVEVHPNTGAGYASLQISFGAGNGSITATFDLKRYQLVGWAPSVAPTRTWCLPLANGNFLIGMTFTSPATVAAGENNISIRKFSGPVTSELGVTAASTYWRAPMLNTGKYKTYVARTT